MKRKSPWVAAVLNLLLPGSGYIYTGNRMRFGVLLVAAMVLAVLGPAPEYTTEASTNLMTITADPGVVVMLIAAGMISLAFAYDAYVDAANHNERLQSEHVKKDDDTRD